MYTSESIEPGGPRITLIPLWNQCSVNIIAAINIIADDIKPSKKSITKHDEDPAKKKFDELRSIPTEEDGT